MRYLLLIIEEKENGVKVSALDCLKSSEKSSSIIMRKKTEQIARPQSVRGAMKEVHGKASLIMMTNSGSKGSTYVS
jgi:hypothetical protein